MLAITYQPNDPIKAALADYEAGAADFNQNAPEAPTDAFVAYAAKSIDPPLQALRDWREPAQTREGAIMALQFALAESGAFAGVDTVPGMIRAALGYLKSQSGAGGADPLLAAVVAYRVGVARYNAMPDAALATVEADDKAADATFGPIADLLSDATPEATSLAGAREAIRLAVERPDSPFADQITRAALAYLDKVTERAGQ